jgi:hypothetical protein
VWRVKTKEKKEALQGLSTFSDSLGVSPLARYRSTTRKYDWVEGLYLRLRPPQMLSA